jgi:hypothetical protein
MNKVFYIVFFCLFIMTGCAKSDIKSDSNGVVSSADKKISVKKENPVPVSNEIVETIKKYLRTKDPDFNDTLLNTINYGSIDQTTDIYIACLVSYGDLAHTMIGGYYLSAFTIQNDESVIAYDGYFEGSADIYSTEDEKKALAGFPGIVLPYGCCYDFNGDGKNEIAMLILGGRADFLVFYTYGKQNESSVSDSFYECGKLTIWSASITHPVQWIKYKGREGFKAYYYASESDWPEDNSIPNPWFICWNEKINKMEPLEEMNE